MTTRWHCAIAALLAVTGCGGNQPRVDGKSLTEWCAGLDAEDPEDRVFAIRRIACFGPGANAAVPAVATRLTTSTDARERTAAADALRSIATPAARDAVGALLASPDTPALAFAEAAVAGAALLPPAEFDRLVRIATFAQLGATLLADRTFEAALPRGPRRADLLLALATGATAMDARAEDALVRRLALLGSPAAPALPFLARALASGRGGSSATLALLAIGDEQAAQILVEHLAAASPALRAEGMATLGALLESANGGAATARQSLHSALSSGEAPASRRAAIQALGAHGGPPDLLPLSALLVEDPLAATALDAMIELVQRNAVPVAAAHAAWTAAARAAVDPTDGRRIARAFVAVDRAHAEAARELDHLAAERPELIDAILSSLSALAAIEPEAAWAAEARVLSRLDAERSALLGERFARRLEQAMLADDEPARRRATAAVHLFDLAPDRVAVPIRVDDRRILARLRLGPSARAIVTTPAATLHLPTGSPPIEWQCDATEDVVWLDEHAERVADPAVARFALTMPSGAELPIGAKLQLDRELLHALTR